VLAGTGSLGLFIVLAVVHTWPLASAPGTLSRNDNGDAILHEWILAWVAHQIVADPLHLFDANIFFPERGTLAYSDHLFVQSMMGAPLLWAGASPVLVHNLVLMAGLALTGSTTSWVVARWTASRFAGLMSGSLVAFNAFTLTRLPQLQDLHLEFFPLALFALDRALAAPRTRYAVELAVWFVLQALTGMYLMVFTAISLAAAAAARPCEWLGARLKQVGPRMLLAAGLAVLVLTPFVLPYYRASATVGLGRSLEDTQRYSAELTDYLVAPGTVYFEWLGWGRRFWAGDALFPGVTAAILACIGVAGSGWSNRRMRMVLILGLVAFLLSFGPAFPPYRALYQVFPLMAGIRGAVRFGEIVLAAIGILAGFGIAVLHQKFPPRIFHPLCLALLLTANLEALRAPLYYSEYRGIPSIYDSLRELSPRAVLVWLPFYGSAQFHQNAPFMLANTRTFHPMLNGYSGFKPPSYYEHAQQLSTFPDSSSIDYLQKLGVTVVLIDGRNMHPARLAAVDGVSELSLWKTDGNLRIYLLERTRATG
jgi:hypothetical protein